MKSNHSQSKRQFLAALASGAVAAPALLGADLVQAATAPPFEVRLAPKYYPKPHHVAEIDLAGKVAVITGASRGIGLAVGLALQALGVQVIGTSRTPEEYAGHPFPLLALDVADPTSIETFTATVLGRAEVQGAGGIDILVNNAGRSVFGSVVPVSPDMYFAGLQTSLATLYGGHIGLTSALLQAVAARAASGYGYILFTTSFAAYSSNGNAYTSAKRALLAYANSLRSALEVSGFGIKVSTLSPTFVNTDIAKGTRPIFLQPVDSNGNAIGNPQLQEALDVTRELLAGGLPASFAAEAYVQILTAIHPEANVAVASDIEPYATQGRTREGLEGFKQEMLESAFPWVAGPKRI